MLQIAALTGWRSTAVDDCRSARMTAAILLFTPDAVQALEQGSHPGVIARGRHAQFRDWRAEAEQMHALAQAARQRRDVEKVNLPATMNNADFLFRRVRRRRQIGAGQRTRQPGWQPGQCHLAFPLRGQIKRTVALAACGGATDQAEQQRAVLS